MWLVLIVPAVLLVIAFAMRPIRTLILVTRFILLLYAVATWAIVIYLNNGTDETVPWYFWALPAVLTLLWMLTFLRRKERTMRVSS